jgi:hypothetical protein
MLVFLLLGILGLSLPLVSQAADCMQAHSIGCFDRYGCFYPNDIRGLPPVVEQ